MNKNVSNLILLLGTLLIFFNACSALRKADDSPYMSSESRSSEASSSTNKVAPLRSKITAYAKKYDGSRYKYGGTTPKGFDCSGFTSFVFKKFDIPITRTSDSQAKKGKKVSIRSAKPGDLVFFGRGRKVTHVALVTKNSKSGLQVIHSTTSRGVIEENVTNSSYWKSRLLFVRNVIDY